MDSHPDIMKRVKAIEEAMHQGRRLDGFERRAGAYSAGVKKIKCCIPAREMVSRIRAEKIIAEGMEHIECTLLKADLPQLPERLAVGPGDV